MSMSAVLLSYSVDHCLMIAYCLIVPYLIFCTSHFLNFVDFSCTSVQKFHIQLCTVFILEISNHLIFTVRHPNGQRIVLYFRPIGLALVNFSSYLNATIIKIIKNITYSILSNNLHPRTTVL